MLSRLLRSLTGKGRAADGARKAEARGELATAAELFAVAEEPGEAARVMILRGDAEIEPRARLLHYTQAVAAAPEGTPARRAAVIKRADLVLAMHGERAVGAVARADVLAAAAELESVGEAARAARAYAVAGDTEGEARALAGAGDVERLEDLLTTEQEKDREARKKKDVSAEIELLALSGRRREALAAAEEHARARPDDLPARERAHRLEGRRAMGPRARVTVSGRALPLVLGAEIVVGRTEGALTVPSNAVSRRHVRVARGAGGEIYVEDLGSRNGTQLHGMTIAGKMPVGEGLELKLGKEVAMRVAPTTLAGGGVEIELAGETWLAPLGDARLGVGAWRLELAADGWIELVSGEPPAFAGDVELAPRATLLVGDAIASARGGEPVLRVQG